MAGNNDKSANISQNISEILATMNLQKPTLSTLAKKGSDSLVQQFLSENLKVNGEESETSRSQLYMASFWGIYEAVKVIIESGADVNSQNPTSLWTPLHAACFQEHGKVVMLLLDHKAEPTIEDSEGRSPVDFASASDKVWPFFAVHGYKKTSNAELLEKGITKQAENEPTSNVNIDMDMNSIRKSILPINYENRGVPQQKDNDRNAYAASVDGDVLAGDTFKPIGEEQPNFNAWRN